MKIAFVGTHGVGKTTLCYELAALLKKQGVDVELVKEVARSCPLPINRETSLLAQLWILHTQIAREIELSAGGGIVVCDRSVLDNYAYLEHSAGRQPEAERTVDGWLGTYALLLRVPPGGTPTADGVRDTDREFQIAIDTTISRLLSEKRVPHIDLSGFPRNRWIGAALAAVAAVRRGDSPESSKDHPTREQMSLFAPKDETSKTVT